MHNLLLWVESNWNVMAHGDARERKWRGNWRMDWVSSTLHTSSEHGVSSITNADAHTSAASRLNWRPCRFKWTRPFRRKTKSGFCPCAITFQTQSIMLTLSDQAQVTDFSLSVLVGAGGGRKDSLTGVRSRSWRPWFTDDSKILSFCTEFGSRRPSDAHNFEMTTRYLENF
jgi:hypothetical protein